MFCREQHLVKLFFSRFRQLLLKDLLTGLEDKLFEKLVSVLTSPTYRESKTWPTILALTAAPGCHGQYFTLKLGQCWMSFFITIIPQSSVQPLQADSRVTLKFSLQGGMSCCAHCTPRTGGVGPSKCQQSAVSSELPQFP